MGGIFASTNCTSTAGPATWITCPIFSGIEPQLWLFAVRHSRPAFQKQLRTANDEQRLAFLLYPCAAAPLTISIISFVIFAWRARFIISVRESIMSDALLVAESMAVIRAACSAATDSISA